MKFVRLDLIAYGPFTRRSFVFPADGPSLHILYGPNEAGKSTTLRAITSLLYGIEKNTDDAHLHPMSDLRVGATLRHTSGQERAFIRKKGNQATLLNHAEQPVDEAQLRAWLSITDRKHFEQMFGLDHEQLREAGAALSDAKTDVGRMLFGASLDGTTLHQTLLRLDAEADKLLSPGGNAGAISKALGAYRDQFKKAREATAPARGWEALQKDLDAAQERRKELSAEIVGVQTQRHRLERLQRALPWLLQRRDARERLRALGDVQLLPLDLDAHRRELVRAIEDAEANLRRAEADIARTAQEREGLVVPEALLVAGARIKQLGEDLGKYKTELRDKPNVVKEIVTFRNEQRELLRQLGHGDLEPAALASLRVDDASIERVRVLDRQGLALQTRLAGLRSRLTQQRALVAQRESALAALPAAADTSVLRATWDHLCLDKALARKISEAESQVAALDASVKAACAALGLWSGSPEAAAALPVPSEETLRQFDTSSAEDDLEARRLGDLRRARTRELDEIRRRLATLTAAGDPPTERQLQEARSRRDHAWELVCRAWSQGAPLSVISEEFNADIPLVAAYAATVRVVDELSDALRRESARAAEYVSLQRDEAVKRAELDAAERDRAALDARAEQRQEAWRQQWLPCGLSPLGPREMLAWRGRHANLLASLRRRDEAASQVEALRRTLLDQQRELRDALAHAGAPVPEGTAWLTLLHHVERLIKQAEEQRRAHESQLHDLQSGRSELAAQEADHATCERALVEWREAWGESVAKLRLSPAASSEEAKVVLTKLSDLFRLEEKCERQEARLKAIQKQLNTFEERVSDTVAELAHDLKGSPTELADGLIERHGVVMQAAARRRALDEQLTRYTRDRDEARIALETERGRFEGLLRDAGCSDPSALEVAIERSAHARELESLRIEAEKRLAEVGEGWTLEALEEAAATTDSDRLETEIAALGEKLKGFEADQHDTTKELGALQERQKDFSGADDAARALTEAHESLALARSHAERYARLRLATALLRRGVESYRQKNEGTILRRASRLFECLTLGRYQQLRVLYEGDKARLRCMRAHEAVAVEEALSDGTLDQLYLSLRLASLEQHLESQEPMPLVLDDIFIHFDDERARAGLQVLAELAEKTQVLLLTHHARNLELARTALKPGAWTEHRLGPPAGVGAGE